MSWVISPAYKDPNYSSVVLLLHGDGADGSTTFTDNSSSPKTVTPIGDAKIRKAPTLTTPDPFGRTDKGVMVFDGNGDYLSLASSSDLYLGATDFTVELWLYWLGADSEFFFWNANSSAYGLRLNISSGVLNLLASLNGSSWAINTAIGVIAANKWTHIAIARNSSSIRVFVNGMAVYENLSFSGNMVQGTINNIGGRSVFPASFNGYIDDLRISKGVARYTANFSVPPAPFPDK